MIDNSKLVELKFGGHIYYLYQHSYDGYGLIKGRDRIITQHLKTNAEDSACISPGKSLKSGDKTVVGNSKGLAECLRLIKMAMFSNTQCLLMPCSFDGVYMPRITETFKHELYAFSYFYDKYAEPFDKSSFLVQELKDAAHQVCSLPTPKLPPTGLKEHGKNSEWCTDLSFMYSLLAVGYSIPHDRQILTAKKIDRIEIGWSLGAAIQMLDTQMTDPQFSKCNPPIY